MATLLSAAGNGTGTGASHTGPATVFVRGTFDGATVVVQVADEDVDASYVKADNVSLRPATSFKAKGCCDIAGRGTYFIRCVVSGGGANTSITAVSTQ